MSQPYVVFVLGEPFIPLRAYHKLFGINVFSEIQTISVCSCDGVVAEGSHDLRMEMPPRDVLDTTALCSHDGPTSFRGFTMYAFRSMDVKVSESYG